MTIKLYGAIVSPYVRKVRLALAYKGLSYEQISVIPSSPEKPAEFVANSPLGKIPLLYIDDIWLSDSRVMLAYLEQSRPEHSLLSANPKLAARALWFEEYAASHMSSVIGGHLFAELILAPHFFKRASNKAEIELARTEEIPAIFDYLEAQLTDDYMVGNDFGHADLCLGSMFITLEHCNEECDSGKWPKTAAYIDRVMGAPVFQSVLADEKIMLTAVIG